MIEIKYANNLRVDEIRARFPADDADVLNIVAAILRDVRENGDAALRRYTAQFDGAQLSSFLVSAEEIEQAQTSIPAELSTALSRAADRIRAFHEKQVTTGFSITDAPGIELGQLIRPIGRAGIYVPGGSARYPSTVLMNVIPAKLAGVRHICIATPPDAQGRVPAATLAAAHMAGADCIYKMGGAQAIAALAYGTKSIAPVDKITGPGNSYVAAAKRLVYGVVDIDMIAGPSEILIIADEHANASYIAADLLSQAEHGETSASILLTTSEALASGVQRALKAQCAALARSAIAEKSMLQNGRIVITASLEEAVAISNEIAPEHLELLVQDAKALLSRVTNAGSIFLGAYSPEPLGDYFAGPNHTLPTNGAARFSSPLGVYDFIKRSSYIQYDAEALQAAARHIVCIAEAEGLGAHANSIKIRFGQ